MALNLKTAPNLKKQPPHAEHVAIVAGTQAWEFADTVQQWQTEADAALSAIGNGTPADAPPPVVLAAEQLERLNAYRLAPKTARYVAVYRTNQAAPLDSRTLTALCLNLALHTKAEEIRLYDEAQELIEDLSDYVQELRTNAERRETAELIVNAAANAAKDDENNGSGENGDRPDKRQPYIEHRTTDGLRGLYRITPRYDNATGDLLSEREQWLCDPVAVTGIGRSESESFLVLQWTPEGTTQPITEALPLRDLGEREGWRQLKARGLKVTNNTALKNELADFLQNSGDRTLWTITHATGWQNGAYILPNGDVLGRPDTPVLFRNQSAAYGGYGTAGTVESWQAEIGRYLPGNPAMFLGVACALAAPLIHLLDVESFGVHLFGGSSAGKTTTANIASSVYGHPDKIRLSWHATGLGLTNEAAARNDNFMPLDEIGQGANRKQIEQTAYALFNGVGKIQGAKDGGNRELQRWRIMAFSTGEIDLEGYLSAGGIKTHAGQLVRLLNVPIQPARVYHGLPDGKAHADHLNQAARANYGAIGRAWIECLLDPKTASKLTALFAGIKQKWLARLPAGASPQVQRVSTRFAVLETALTLSAPLTGLATEDAAEAVLHCFHEWVAVFGMQSREERAVIEQVNGFLLANAEARFIPFPFNPDSPHQGRIANIAGYRMIVTDASDPDNKEHFYLYPQAFDEAISGHPKAQAGKILIDSGMLKALEAGRLTVKLPHKINPNRPRCYLLYPLNESEDDEADDGQTPK